MDTLERDLSQGNVVSQLIRFALPFLLSSLIQSLYNVTDMVIVGQFAGTASMSGVSLGGQVTNLITLLIIGFSTGGTVLIAQYKGFGAREEMKSVIGTLLTLLLIAAAVLTVALELLSVPILRLMQTPPEAFEEARRFLRITMGGSVFIFGYNAFSAVLRGMGNSRHPMLFVAIACGVNVVLDLLLVGVFHMAAAGAAIATVISQALSMALCIVFLRRRGFVFDFHPRSFRIHRAQLGMLAKVGIPISVQNSVLQISFLVLGAMVNTFGVAASAGMGAVAKLNGFTILPAMAICAAISAMSAQNIGAGEEKRAAATMKVGFLISFAATFVLFLLVIAFPYPLLRAFGEDPAMIERGMVYLAAYKYDYLFIPLCFALAGLVIGSGHTGFSFAVTVLSVFVRVPASYLFGFVLHLGIFGIGLGAPLATLGSTVIYVAYYLMGKWKRSAILPAESKAAEGESG